MTLPFDDERFDFVFDMGCFHHVMIEDRERFIRGLCRVLKAAKGQYLLICFSDKNGPAWNHFTKQQLTQYFSERFNFKVCSISVQWKQTVTGVTSTAS